MRTGPNCQFPPITEGFLVGKESLIVAEKRRLEVSTNEFERTPQCHVRFGNQYLQLAFSALEVSTFVKGENFLSVAMRKLTDVI